MFLWPITITTCVIILGCFYLKAMKIAAQAAKDISNSPHP